ncbi:hypothetical protein J19TS2_31190 [Cohnella xylanilytica]|nr:hypothetical protein J19TS2_31190 [Cohnella xylanilytica]
MDQSARLPVEVSSAGMGSGARDDVRDRESVRAAECGVNGMRGQRPTLRQKQIIEAARLQPENWLVLKNPPGQLVLQHKHTGKERVIIL